MCQTTNNRMATFASRLGPQEQYQTERDFLRSHSSEPRLIGLHAWSEDADGFYLVRSKVGAQATLPSSSSHGHCKLRDGPLSGYRLLPGREPDGAHGGI